MSNYKKYDVIGAMPDSGHLAFENKIYVVLKSNGESLNRYFINTWKKNPKKFDIYFYRFGHSNCSLGPNKHIDALLQMEDTDKEVTFYKNVKLLIPIEIPNDIWGLI